MPPIDLPKMSIKEMLEAGIINPREALKMRYREPKPAMEEFEDVYSFAKIKKDIDELARVKAKRKVRDEENFAGDCRGNRSCIEESRRASEENIERADLLEGLLEDSISQNDWFGKNVSVARTAEFDDWMNHTDLVVEWPSEDDDGEPLRLAVDVTVTSKEQGLNKKMDSTLEEARTGNFTTVEYVDSEISGKGKMEKVPRVILGLSAGMANELNTRLEKIILGKEPAADMAYHYLQLRLLEQARAQLAAQIFDKAANYFEMAVYTKRSRLNETEEGLFKLFSGAVIEEGAIKPDMAAIFAQKFEEALPRVSLRDAAQGFGILAKILEKIDETYYIRISALKKAAMKKGSPVFDPGGASNDFVQARLSDTNIDTDAQRRLARMGV